MKGSFPFFCLSPFPAIHLADSCVKQSAHSKLIVSASSAFENKIEHLEYLQIFAYTELIIQGKNNVKISDYHDFELTDTIVNSYNKWITNSNYKASIFFEYN